VGQWLDDEIVNYFVKKWCTKARRTLGFSTFFTCKILFQDALCINAKSGVLTREDEEVVLRWCRKAEVRLSPHATWSKLQHIFPQKVLGFESWDSIFIPINEDHCHWYSAFIDFRNKRIEIYDSLRETCLVNRQKPVALRKNANLMLVSAPQLVT
jgi:Ulp1 family protease